MHPHRRCRCDRQRVPHRRARVGGLCGFCSQAERVPTGSPKTGRCADVRERCRNEKEAEMPTEFYCEKWLTEQIESRCRRCTCDRRPFPRRRARVGGLCGFRGTVEHVPARSHKSGRCAGVRELYGNGRHRRKPPAGGLRRREKPQSARQEKAKVSCAHLGRHICPQCGQFGTFGQGLLRGQKQPCWGRKRR